MSYSELNPILIGFHLRAQCYEKGKLLSFYLTKGNDEDRNPKHVKKMTEEFFRKMYADKGYITNALRQMSFADGIHLFTKHKKNMKGTLWNYVIKSYSKKG